MIIYWVCAFSLTMSHAVAILHESRPTFFINTIVRHRICSNSCLCVSIIYIYTYIYIFAGQRGIHVEIDCSCDFQLGNSHSKFKTCVAKFNSHKSFLTSQRRSSHANSKFASQLWLTSSTASFFFAICIRFDTQLCTIRIVVCHVFNFNT